MSKQFDQVQFVTISEENNQQRIDNFLIRTLKGVPKSKIYKIVRKGEVRVNKKRVKPEYKLRIDDIVRVPPVKTGDSGPQNLSTFKLDYLEQAILYEDERLIVINKPSGLAVHGGSGLQFGLIEALRSLRPQQQFLELVHRLDRDTSGCIVIAKKRSALRHIHEQLRSKTIEKNYHALVDGLWPSQIKVVKQPLYKNQMQSGERMVFVDEKGKPSETRFKILRRFDNATLVQAQPITGRTHQIRVHAQFAGHSIANDSKYGDEQFSKDIQNMGCKRLCLHAKSIRFIHPLSEEVLNFDAPYDKEFSKIIERLANTPSVHV